MYPSGPGNPPTNHSASSLGPANRGTDSSQRRSSATNAVLPADEDDDEQQHEGASSSSTAKKKRKRVVVACDTCRRKKVKCQGLPNASSTCNNCAAYNYKCTFTADNDRSRGKYEILESKVDALFSALQAVAPRLAEDFKQGRLTARDTASGTDASMDSSHAAASALPAQAFLSPPSQQLHFARRAPPGPRTGASHFEASAMLPPLSSATGSRDLPSLKGMGLDTHMPRRASKLTQMVPDLEDGRPRFFGRSSTLSVFHSMDSRPPSPSADRNNEAERGDLTPSTSSTKLLGSHRNGPAVSEGQLGKSSRPPSQSSASAAHAAGASAAGKDPSPLSSAPVRPEQGVPGRADQRNKGWKTLPQPQPLYPSNSREWVHLLRTKNTVAIGRDDFCSDEWATRYMLPSLDLVFHLLDDIYFPHLHPLLPILHPPTFRRDIRSGRATHDTAFRGLVFCVMTISARFSADRRVLADPADPGSAGDQWAAGSRLYHQAFAASLINVQMLLLTSTFMHASIGPGSAWTVLGMAVRAAIDIGLHQERAHQHFKPFDQEMRRRAFWSAFVLDCIFTICLGRPSAIKLEDCNVKLPMDVSDEALSQAEATGAAIAVDSRGPQTPSAATGFRHLCKLNLLVHEVVSLLYVRKRQLVPRVKADPSKVFGGNEASVTETADPVAKEEDDEDVALPMDERPGTAGSRSDKGAFSGNLLPSALMTTLCEKLDRWVEEIPDHLRKLESSPFKLQAGIILCGAHDVRLYILKPFLADEAIHRRMHSQCATHARICLRTVVELYEGDHLRDMVFVFMQAFMSAATFLLTVWHMTSDTDMLAADAHLIEQTAHMMTTAFDDRYCSSVVRKAWRVLQRVAVRAMPFMSDEVRERTQGWISTARLGAEILLPACMFAPTAGYVKGGDGPAQLDRNEASAEAECDAGVDAEGVPNGGESHQSMTSAASVYDSTTGDSSGGHYAASAFGIAGGSGGYPGPGPGPGQLHVPAPMFGWSAGEGGGAVGSNRTRASPMAGGVMAAGVRSRRGSPHAYSHEPWAQLSRGDTSRPATPSNGRLAGRKDVAEAWSSTGRQATALPLTSSSRSATTGHLGLTTPAMTAFDLSNFGDVHGILGDGYLGAEVGSMHAGVGLGGIDGGMGMGGGGPGGAANSAIGTSGLNGLLDALDALNPIMDDVTGTRHHPVGGTNNNNGSSSSSGGSNGNGLPVTAGSNAPGVVNGDAYSYLGSEGLWQDWFSRYLDGEVER
ncbi:unnamed protein product [Parajaminaea phylloscopi]